MKICGKLNPTVQRTGISPTATLLPPIFLTNTGRTVCTETKLMASEKMAPSQTFATKFHLRKGRCGSDDRKNRLSTKDFDLLRRQRHRYHGAILMRSHGKPLVAELLGQLFGILNRQIDGSCNKSRFEILR